MYIQAFAVVISVSVHFLWLCRNLFCELMFVSDHSVPSLLPLNWQSCLFDNTNDLTQCEENPTTNIIQVRHQNKLFFGE